MFYRDRWHRADTHHPGLIDEAVFADAEQVLLARGDDHIHRTGARSVSLLAGLIFCTRCGKRYQGTSARGNRYTCRYTTELAAVETELVKTEAAIDRYLTAFENQTMPEATCAPRIRGAATKPPT